MNYDTGLLYSPPVSPKELKNIFVISSLASDQVSVESTGFFGSNEPIFFPINIPRHATVMIFLNFVSFVWQQQQLNTFCGSR